MRIKPASDIFWAIKLLPLASRSTRRYVEAIISLHAKGGRLSHWSKRTNGVMGADTCQVAFRSHGDLVYCVGVRLTSCSHCSHAPPWRREGRRGEICHLRD